MVMMLTNAQAPWPMPLLKQSKVKGERVGSWVRCEEQVRLGRLGAEDHLQFLDEGFVSRNKL
jgi:hypothetical protein